MLRIILLPAMLILLLGIAALAVVLYKRYYTKQINRVLENGGTAVAPIPALHSAWKVILFLLLFVCFCMWEAKKNEEISQLRQSNESMSYVMSRTWDTVKRMDAQLTDMQSIFTSFDYQTEDLDPVARTMSLRVTAQPKEEYLDPTVTLRYNGESIELARGADGYYSAVVSMDPFRLPESDYATLCLTADGRTKTEEVYLLPDVRSCFPKVEFTLDDENIRMENDVLSIKGWLNLYVSEPEKVRSMHLLIKHKDEVLKDLDLTGAIGGKTPIELLQEEYSNLSPVRLVLRWEDSYGLIHESEPISFAASSVENGEIEYRAQPDGFELLYDADGNLLGELK